MHGRMSEPAMGAYTARVGPALCPSPNQSGIGQRHWGFHTVRGVDPGEHRFRSRGVVVEEIRRDLRSGNRALSSPGGAGSTRFSQSAIGQRDRGFNIVRGGADPEEFRFHPRGFRGVVIYNCLQISIS